MPRFAANLSLLFQELPPAGRVAAAARAGFAAVEVQFPYAREAGVWAEELGRAGVPLVLFNVPAGDLMQGGDGLAGVPGREAEFAAALEQAAAWAAVLRPRCVNVLAGRQPAGQTRAACLAVLRANLQRAVDRLAPLGVTVTLEAINRHDMPRFLVADFATQAALVAEVPGSALQFDIYHMAMAGEPVAGLIASRGAEFAHVQFADCPGRGAPGSGGLDLPALFRALDDAGCRVWCGAEYRPAGPTGDSLGWLPRATGGPPVGISY